MYCKLKIFWSLVDNLRQWSWSWRIKRSESRRTTRKRCTRITWNIYMYYPLYYDDYIIVFEKYIFTFYICTLCLLQMIKSNSQNSNSEGNSVQWKCLNKSSKQHQNLNKYATRWLAKIYELSLSSSRWRLHILMNC